MLWLGLGLSFPQWEQSTAQNSELYIVLSPSKYSDTLQLWVSNVFRKTNNWNFWKRRKTATTL